MFRPFRHLYLRIGFHFFYRLVLLFYEKRVLENEVRR